ncbi:KR domain-containing protein [Streptomyces armeniacus]|nr:KR domain-containing protein [Streptomyces armeniacus]
MDSAEASGGDRHVTARESIAIVGVGCRFPDDADGPDAYWRLLRSGGDAVTEFPADRADDIGIVRPDPGALGDFPLRGGFLRRVDRFEPAVFGIPAHEAPGMDPQQRLALEVAWEALEHAGYAPDSLDGTATGVYLGVSSSDYARLRQLYGNPRDVDAHQLLGERSYVAGRISRALGLRGPSKVTDTGGSSSLVSVHEACQELRDGGCDLALAGGVHLLLSPFGFALLERAGGLSAQGRCRTFDAAADGCVRGEGAAVVVLKRFAEAVRDGDTVLAVIEGSAVCHAGLDDGPEGPGVATRRHVVERALARAGVSGAEVDYVEAHGTGVPESDAAELRALQAAIGCLRPPDSPLLVGSVTANIGHLEAAAGIAGLVKLVLSLRYGEIPAQVHFLNPTPRVDWSRLRIDIARQTRAWPSAAGRRPIGGVSGFGASGTSAHLVVALPPEPAPEPAPEPVPRHERHTGPGVLLVSAHTESALTELSRRYTRDLRRSVGLTHADACWTSQVGRARQSYGIAVAGDSTDELAEALEAYNRGEPDTRVRMSNRSGSEGSGVAWLFPGHGTERFGLVRELAGLPAFRAPFEECRALFEEILDRPVDPLPVPGPAPRPEPRPIAPPELFAAEYALARMWLGWGLRPAALLGQGCGEIVAACVAEAVSLPDAVRLVALHTELTAGTADEAVPDGTSPGGRLDAAADGIRYAPPVFPLLSQATGRAWTAPADGAGRRALPAPEPVRFRAGLTNLYLDGVRTFLELGPGELLSLGNKAVDDPDCAWIPSLSPPDRHGRGPDGRAGTLLALGSMALRGAEPDWRAVHGDARPRRVPLPTSVWRGSSYWFEKPAGERAAETDGSRRSSEPLLGLGQRLRGAIPTYEIPLDGKFWEPFVRTDQHGRRYLTLGPLGKVVLAVAGDALGGRWTCMEELISHQLIPMDGSKRLLQLTVRSAGHGHATVECHSVSAREEAAGAPWQLHGQAILRRRLTTRPRRPDLQFHRYGDSFPYQTASLHPALMDRVTSTRRGGDGVLVALAPDDMESSHGLVAAVDAAVAALFWDVGAPDHEPGENGFARVLRDVTCEEPHRIRYVRATAQPTGDGPEHTSRTSREVRGEAEFYDYDGAHVGGIRELFVVEPETVKSDRTPWQHPDDLLMRIEWQRTGRLPGPRRLTGESVLLLPDGEGVAAQLEAELRQRGAHCLVAEPYEAVPDHAVLARLLDRWLADAGADARTRRVVVLTGLDAPVPDELDAEDLLEYRQRTELTVLALVQELAAAPEHASTSVSLVTRGAMPVLPEHAVTCPVAATLWGLGRALAVERPQHWGGAVDLDPVGPSRDEDGTALLAALLDVAAEDQQALRGRDRYVARLVRQRTNPRQLRRQPQIRTTGSYLITGGFGGIGQAVAHWLAQQGAGRLILLGRTPLPHRSDWDAPGHSTAVRARIAAVRDLEATGVPVEVAVADVSDAEQLGQVVSGCAGSAYPLCGVVHAAGSPAPQPLQDLAAEDPHEYDAVWRPKVVGGWLLHQLTEDLRLDFFLSFSTASTVWGERHQAGNCAANAFLDGLAEYRHAVGEAALTVSWSPWETASSLYDERALATLAALGLRPLAHPQCLQLLGMLLAGPAPSAIVCAANWQVYKPMLEQRRARPVLRGLG